ncbi:MAG: FadR family transcriptional regulator [Deltaproteobacteria bacterium]|nr:FadR family transcriptional regulator [Deltaproteobacteria bacterium]
MKKVMAKILSQIDEGRLKPGDRIPSERELSQAMDVSRHTLREAIKCLESYGTLESRLGSGTYIKVRPQLVASWNSGSQKGPRMTDIFQFRMAIEPNIAFLAATTATKAGLVRVENNLKLQRQAEEDCDIERWAAADREFHLLLAELTGNPLFIKSMRRLSRTIADHVDNSHLSHSRIGSYHDNHVSIYRAILQQDSKKAFFHMEEHLRLLPWVENLETPYPTAEPAALSIIAWSDVKAESSSEAKTSKKDKLAKSAKGQA